MTAFDRFEQRLPELMDELAATRTPDYFDDMLLAAAKTRQRPAWSALERWLPMGVIAQPLPVRPMPWRLIAIAALVALLAVASLIYVGGQRRVPPPFGLAANGALVIGTADGDIATVDPTTGATTPLIGGPNADSGPAFSNDGQRFVFDRNAEGLDRPPLYVANADGSGVRELLPADNEVRWFQWAPRSDRALIVDDSGSVSILTIDTGGLTRLVLDLDVASAAWRPNHDEIVVAADSGGGDSPTRTYWVVNADGSGTPREIPVSQYAIGEPTLTPDGASLVYATWELVPGPPRIVGIDTGGDRPLIANPLPGLLWQTPIISPDGSGVLIYQFIEHTYSANLALISVADGTVTTFGSLNENPQPDLHFSPDGTKILATYESPGTTWMFDADGSNGHQAAFYANGGSSWQRVAR